jgi:formylglycine-generating enzyme required for sulfatase activity
LGWVGIGICPVSSIFISHSSYDNAWAERIREWLLDEQEQRPQEQRFRSLFLDFDPDDGIQAGERWRDQLYEHLQLCAAVIVICSEAYAASQWCLAELGVAMASGKLVLPVRIAAGTPLPKLLSETQATALAVIDLEQGTDSGWERLLIGLEPLSWQSRLPWPPPGEPGASPFPGLHAFERRHAAVFFGQDQVRLELQAAINQLPQRQSRLLLILGASGCGKSSLLRAGLVPWLTEADRRLWIVLEPFRPGKKPFDWLHQALSDRFAAVGGILEGEPALTVEMLSDQLEDLRRLSGQQDARVVIPIDQFEELLGRGNDLNQKVAVAADAFLNLLAELLAMEDSQVLIIATLRSDFYGQLQLHPSGLHRLAGPPLPLGPMDPAGFRQVIEGPAQRVGLRLESALSDALVNDTATGDALPLLAFTLEELWKKRVAGAGLTLEQYKAFGRLNGAVQRTADAVLSSSGAGDGEIAALQEAFVEHLIRLTSDGHAAKQPARRSALPAPSRRLVDLFVKARLLVAGKGDDHDQVEIAHEALLRTWPTLVGWIVAGRESLLQRLRARRLAEDLKPHAPERQRRQALEQLAELAAAGGNERRAVEKEATGQLAALLAQGTVPEENRRNEEDRQDAALVLALIGAEEPLVKCLANPNAPMTLRRRAAESLGLLAKRSGKADPQAIELRQRIEAVLEGWLRSDALNLLVVDTEGWAQHDARLPLLQGASRGLQLAASTDLPLLGSGSGREVPMLTLTAMEEGSGLRIRTEVVEVPVWKLPLPGGEQLELVVVPAGTAQLGSPATEHDRSAVMKWFAANRDGCNSGVDVEALRPVRLDEFALVRQPISQRQWRVVVENVGEIEQELDKAPGLAKAENLWDRYGQPGEFAVDSVSWHQSQEWLRRLNRWLQQLGPDQGFTCKAPQLMLPSENEWEGACRAGSKTPFHFGDTLDASWALYDATAYPFGRGRKGAKDGKPWINGTSGLVNRLGLTELHGQLWEWCEDSWHPNPAGDGRPEDCRPWRDEDANLLRIRSVQRGWKLLRGGSWFVSAHNSRAAVRMSFTPGYNDSDYGLRPCCPAYPCSSN